MSTLIERVMIMNKVILLGRLTRDPECKIDTEDSSKSYARYTLAVNRKVKNGENEADFISCVAFGKSAEFVNGYLKQGVKIVITGRLQTGSYMKEDQKVYTTDVVVEEHEFA